MPQFPYSRVLDHSVTIISFGDKPILALIPLKFSIIRLSIIISLIGLMKLGILVQFSYVPIIFYAQSS